MDGGKAEALAEFRAFNYEQIYMRPASVAQGQAVVRVLHALVEYYADEDVLTENWKPRDFEPGPTVFAEWAVAGGIDGNTRRQKSG